MERTDHEAGLNCRAEHFVIAGYRLWALGLRNRDLTLWEDCWRLHAGALDRQQAKLVLGGLSGFVEALALGTDRRLRNGPPGCPYFIRQECLVLALLSGLQHGHDGIVALSLADLCGSGRSASVETAAGTYAILLKGARQMLLPVRRGAIAKLVSQRGQPGPRAAPGEATLH